MILSDSLGEWVGVNNLNISIDDVSPHPQSSTKVLDRCFELIDSFSDIKFTLFVPIAYWRTMRSGVSTSKPYLISDYPDFCSEIKNLPTKNFQIGFHGYYHGIPNVTDNDEFKDLKYDEAIEKIKLMKVHVKKSGLEDSFSPIFRPPAWKMSPDSFRAFHSEGISNFAIFPLRFCDIGYTQAKTYKNEDENKKYKKSYATCFPPFVPLALKSQTNIVYHACEWDKNYLSKGLADELRRFISSNNNTIKFKFL